MWWASWVTKRNINTTESSEAGKPYDTSLSHMDSQIYSYLLFKLVAKHGLVVISAAIQGIRRFITSWRVICCNARHSKSEHKTLFLNSIQFLLPIDLSNPLYLIRIVCLHQTHSVLEVHFLIFLVQHCIHYLNHFEVHFVCLCVGFSWKTNQEGTKAQGGAHLSLLFFFISILSLKILWIYMYTWISITMCLWILQGPGRQADTPSPAHKRPRKMKASDL